MPLNDMVLMWNHLHLNFPAQMVEYNVRLNIWDLMKSPCTTVCWLPAPEKTPLFVLPTLTIAADMFYKGMCLKTCFLRSHVGWRPPPNRHHFLFVFSCALSTKDIEKKTAAYFIDCFILLTSTGGAVSTHQQNAWFKKKHYTRGKYVNYFFQLCPYPAVQREEPF